MYRIGRILFILGGILLLLIFLIDALVLQTYDSVPTKVVAVIATTLLVWFADSGKGDQEI